jgi:hypothetical protein
MGILDSVFAFLVGGGVFHRNPLAPGLASGLSVDTTTT